MQSVRYSLIVLLLLLPSLSFSTEIKRVLTAARISAVTVYPDRALTSRTGRFSNATR